MIVRNLEGDMFHLANESEIRFGKTFQKAQRIKGTYTGYSIGSSFTYISNDSIIEFWED